MSARWKFNDGLAEGSPTCANPKSSSSSGLWKSADFPTKSAFGKLVFAVASGLCFALIAPRAWCAQQGAGAVPSVPEEAEKQYQKALEGFQDRSKPIDIQSFQDVAAKATNCAAAHAILAWAYFLSSTGPEDVHSSDIMKELDIAVSLEPNNPKVYVTRGTLKFLVTKTQIPLLPRNPDDIPPDIMKGFESAISDFDAAIKIDEHCFAAHLNKGVVLTRISKNLDAMYEFLQANSNETKETKYQMPTLANEFDAVFVGSSHPFVFVSSFNRYMIEKQFTKRLGKKALRSTPYGQLEYFEGNDDIKAFTWYLIGDIHPNPASAFDACSTAIRYNPSVRIFHLTKGGAAMELGKSSSDVEKELEKLSEQAKKFEKDYDAKKR